MASLQPGQPLDVEPVVAAEVAADRHQVNAVFLGQADEGVPVLHAGRFEAGGRVEHFIDADGLPDAVESHLNP
jgi:hypothetical protein